MPASSSRPRDTGLLELRSYAPSGRRLGTAADCYDGSKWELHRGELVEQMSSKDIHGLLMLLIGSLFRTHARPGVTGMADVYCDLTDEQGPSIRAPDVVLVGDLQRGKDDYYRGIPIVAVEIRATQAKRHLDEKVALYLEHAWPCIWLVHAEKEEIEIVRPGMGSVVYRAGSRVPLVPELDRFGLREVPLSALFNQEEATRYDAEWARSVGREAGLEAGLERGRTEGLAKALRRVLARRGLSLDANVEARLTSCSDEAILERWIDQATVAESIQDALK